MPKGTITPVNKTLVKAASLGEFTVKELEIPYSALKSFLDNAYIKEAGSRQKEGRGRNPKTFKLTAKGKKAATAA